MAGYRIIADGEIIGDLSDTELAYYNGRLEEAINESGRFEFSMNGANPKVKMVSPMLSVIDLRQGNATRWRGRITSATQNKYNVVSFVSEGVLAWLRDILIEPPVSYSGLSAQTFITYVLAQYNASCSPNHQIHVGEIDQNTKISLSVTEYLSAFDLLSILISQNGGYFTVSYTDTSSFLNYFAEPDTAGQEINFAENLLDITQVTDATKIITVLTAKSKFGTYEAINEDAVAKYGKIYAYKYFDSVTSSTEFYQAADEYLNSMILGGQSITVTAVDLSLLDADIAPFAVGNTARVKSAPHGIDISMVVSRKITDINNPAASQITLGLPHETLTAQLWKG